MSLPTLSEFDAVLQRGDRAALEKMLGDLDDFLRMVIHLRLIDQRLGHIVRTTDILQSLLADFLSQKADHPRPVGKAGGLVAYLKAAVRYKILEKVRKERRHPGGLPVDWEPPSPDSADTRQIDAEDLKQVLRARLSESDRQLFDLRVQGLTWPEITSRVGGRRNTLRMRLRRAVAAHLAALGLAELSHAH